MLRVETQAVHRGEFHGFAPTGKRVTLGGIVIYRIANGRIAESWAELNFGRLIQQLRA